MTKYTALMIQTRGDDIRCEPYGQDEETGKWGVAINLYEDGRLHTTLISSDPIYKTQEEGVAKMRQMVEQVRAMKPVAEEFGKIIFA